MIGPVSGTGRAMMASLQQAIQKGMPPDQAIQYVKSMATQGVAPLTDLYAMMNQFQRLKQQPVQAPQTPPTIRDQLNMAEQQQAQQQMAMQQGLGGLPAPAMEQAQFAGGGIVAFQEGGLTAAEEAEYEKLEDLMVEGVPTNRGGMSPFGGVSPASVRLSAPVSGLQSLYEKRFKELRAKKQAAAQAEVQAKRQAGIAAEGRARGLIPPPAPAQTAVPPPAPDTKRTAPPRTDTTSRGGIDSRVPAAPRVAAEAPVEKKMTLEDFQAPLREAGRPLREATDAYRQSLDKDEASAKEQSGRDRMLALAQAGFGMAQAASKPGATFLGSVGAAGGDFAKSMMQLNREADAAKRGIVKERLALAQAEAAGNKSDYIAAYQNLTGYEKTLTEAARFEKSYALQRAELALQGSRLNAEIARAARQETRDEAQATARENELRVETRIKIADAIITGMEKLKSDPDYIDASDADKIKIREAKVDEITRIYTGKTSAVGGGGGTSSLLNEADKIAGIGGPG